MRRKHVVSSLILAGAVLSTLPLSGCAGTSKNDGKTEVTMVQYKPEAVAAFEEMEERFNATHDDIHLTIESPNEAMTVLNSVYPRGLSGHYRYRRRLQLLQLSGRRYVSGRFRF